MDNYFAPLEQLEPKSIHLPHMPILLLADNSISTIGDPICSEMLSINRFAADICKDPKAAAAVDIAVVSFNDEPTIEQNWRPIGQMQPVELKAEGGTNLSRALELGVQMLRERANLYQDSGIEVKMPYLILLTDGYGGDVTEIAKVIKKRTDEHKMKLWVLAIRGYDKETIAKLTDGKRVFELVDEAGFDFSEFFDFMAVSVKAVSTSAPGQDTVSVKHNIGREGSKCRVPDLDKWLNE